MLHVIGIVHFNTNPKKTIFPNQDMPKVQIIIIIIRPNNHTQTLTSQHRSCIF